VARTAAIPSQTNQASTSFIGRHHSPPRLQFKHCHDASGLMRESRARSADALIREFIYIHNAKNRPARGHAATAM
jgi:hypothetical protein